MTTINDYITDTARPIYIASGEGENGTLELYTGARTMRAIKCRLTRERSGGDRFAAAYVWHSASVGYGDGWADIETGALRSLPVANTDAA